MKTLGLILIVALLTGCGDPTKSSMQTLEADATSCKRMGGTPKVAEGLWEKYIQCEFPKEMR